MRVYEEIDVYDFMLNEAWSGARSTINELTIAETRRVANEIEAYFADSYGDVTKTQINDLIWFEDDLIATFAGFDSWDDMIRYHDWEDGKTIEELITHPATYADELEELRENIASEADEDEDEPSEATRLMMCNGWDVDEITLPELEEYYSEVHFAFEDFCCHM